MTWPGVGDPPPFISASPGQWARQNEFEKFTITPENIQGIIWNFPALYLHNLLSFLSPKSSPSPHLTPPPPHRSPRSGLVSQCSVFSNPNSELTWKLTTHSHCLCFHCPGRLERSFVKYNCYYLLLTPGDVKHSSRFDTETSLNWFELLKRHTSVWGLFDSPSAQ